RRAPTESATPWLMTTPTAASETAGPGEAPGGCGRPTTATTSPPAQRPVPPPYCEPHTPGKPPARQVCRPGSHGPPGAATPPAVASPVPSPHPLLVGSGRRHHTGGPLGHLPGRVLGLARVLGV